MSFSPFFAIRRYDYKRLIIPSQLKRHAKRLPANPESPLNTHAGSEDVHFLYMIKDSARTVLLETVKNQDVSGQWQAV
jgi:hypothetical protein